MSTETPGQPSLGSWTVIGSSSQRNSTPPAIHRAAVQTGYRATHTSSSSPAVRIPTLLRAPPRIQDRENEQRDEERRHGYQQPDPDGPAVVEQPGGDDQRHQPQDRAEHEPRNQATTR